MSVLACCCFQPAPRLQLEPSQSLPGETPCQLQRSAVPAPDNISHCASRVTQMHGCAHRHAEHCTSRWLAGAITLHACSLSEAKPIGWGWDDEPHRGIMSCSLHSLTRKELTSADGKLAWSAAPLPPASGWCCPAAPLMRVMVPTVRPTYGHKSLKCGAWRLQC